MMQAEIRVSDSTAYLLKADAFYRAPMDHLYWFMTLHELGVAGAAK